MKDNYTKMMDAAIRQGLIKWEPKVGDKYYFCRIVIRTPSRCVFTDEIEGTAYLDSSLLSRLKGNEITELIYRPTIEQLMGMVPDICELELGRSKLKKDKDIAIKTWFAVIDDYPVFKSNSSQGALVQAVIHKLHDLEWEGNRWTKFKDRPSTHCGNDYGIPYSIRGVERGSARW